MRLLVDAHCFDYKTSEGINTHIKGLYGELVKNENNIFVTPNAVSEDFWQINKNEASDFIKNKGIGNYILYVSRMEPRKISVHY